MLTAVTLYKASLEGLRDWVVLPRWDEQMYQRYRSSRLAGDLHAGGGPEVIETAYNDATGMGSAYNALKQRIYDDMIRAKGLNKEIIGTRFDRALWAQIDAYLVARMELRFQRDYLREHRAEVIQAYWRGARDQLTVSSSNGKTTFRRCQCCRFGCDGTLPGCRRIPDQRMARLRP